MMVPAFCDEAMRRSERREISFLKRDGCQRGRRAVTHRIREEGNALTRRSSHLGLSRSISLLHLSKRGCDDSVKSRAEDVVAPASCSE